ncbi:S8 family serine peptidase, partial [bacterium]|nr:S8 family serine peptidase [bacterium]
MPLFLCGVSYGKEPGSAAGSYFIVFHSPPVYEMQERAHPLQSSTAAYQAKRASVNRYARELRQRQNETLSQIQSVAPTVKVVRRFSRLVNAICVEIDAGALEQVQALPEVAYVAPNRRAKLFLTEPDQMMARQAAWDVFGGGNNAGEGILIGIIDTGIDMSNPCFDDSNFVMPVGFPKGQTSYTNNKIIVARSFPPENGDQGDKTPRDREGHGTNVASVAAANFQVQSPLGKLSGIAPKAYLGNYKVFTGSNGAGFDQIIEALEQAVEDGCDVVNLSLGVDNYIDSRHDPIGIAVRNAIRQNVVVVSAAGNSGQKKMLGGIAQIEDAIAVGSISNTHSQSGTTGAGIDVYVNGELVLEDVNARIGISDQPFIHDIYGTFSLQDVDLMDGMSYGGPEDGRLCEAFHPDSPVQGWALVQRGECLFTDKAKRAQEAGAVGMLLYDNEISNTIPQLEGALIPVLMIDRADGLEIKDYLLENDNQHVRMEVFVREREVAGGTLSSFSSIGPAADYNLKPDFMAVGEGNYGATQDEFTDSELYSIDQFTWIQGTSFSSPRVAGLAALMKAKHPDWPVSWIKSAMKFTAISDIDHFQGSSRTTTLLERGAGRVDAENSLLADTICYPVMVNFDFHVAEQSQTVKRVVTIRNISDIPCEYSLLADANRFAFPVLLDQEQFTLNPRETRDVELSIEIPGALSAGEHEQILILENLTTGQSYELHAWVSIIDPQPAVGNILIIDDDDGDGFEFFYIDALDGLGETFTHWDVEANGDYPKLAFMNQFDTVIWFMTANSLYPLPEENNLISYYANEYNPRHLFESDLARYLTEGGSLFLSAQDYLDNRETAAFTREVLGVEMAKHDDSVSIVRGFSNNPI